MLLAGPGQRPSVEDGGRRIAGYGTFGRIGMPAICGGWEGASTLGKERERWNALQPTEHAAPHGTRICSKRQKILELIHLLERSFSGTSL